MEELLLVNKQNPLPQSYLPEKLVLEVKSEIWIQEEVHQAFGQMNRGAQAAGIRGLVLVSGYRCYQYQKKVYNRKVDSLIKAGLTKEEASQKAQTIVALPGTSEHQTGLAMDLTNTTLARKKDPLIEEFAQTDEGKWLDLHAHEYGFILRYPKEKMGITHITYEPWHYRYVGIYHARKIKEANICLEEYVLEKRNVSQFTGGKS